MTLDTLFLVLRILLVAVLYLFLMQVVLMAWRDLRQASVARALPAAPATPASSRARLLVVASPSADVPLGAAYALDRDVTIGRTPDNTIALADTFISAHHAHVVYRTGGWWAEDLGSTNGTLVNGERIDAPTALAPGDVVQVGPISLRLEQIA